MSPSTRSQWSVISECLTPATSKLNNTLCAEFLIAFAVFPPLQITTQPHIQVKQNGAYKNINSDLLAKSIKLILQKTSTFIKSVIFYVCICIQTQSMCKLFICHKLLSSIVQLCMKDKESLLKMISSITLPALYINCTLVCVNPYQSFLEKELRYNLSSTFVKLYILIAFKFSSPNPKYDEGSCWMMSF